MADSERFRLFIAVGIPDGIKSKIEAAQAELRRVLPARNVRWTRREQFHLTLRFLGDVEAARVDSLGEAMRRACHGFEPLRLRGEGVGCFPEHGYPRVLWTGVRDEEEQLPRLHAAVELASRGFTTEAKEERFTGHVTLARIKGIKRAEAEALSGVVAGMKDRLFGHWTAYKIELMRSELLPQGARHTPLATIALTESPASAYA
ncbi:MAG TPA: RNA 2',3'-cyclic phosphodiesterase [Candidatus Paceibacterota bacterium]|nr:RNA 2',3'-cyclic phosphodiesterase [Verrucomicrobiota bacterium]HSA10157.1 RNA 2',3'-cyclic phosphodiesterase [Candidatus Paceibacterota bacterium]